MGGDPACVGWMPFPFHFLIRPFPIPRHCSVLVSSISFLLVFPSPLTFSNEVCGSAVGSSQCPATSYSRLQKLEGTKYTHLVPIIVIFYWPNNKTVCTFASIPFQESRTARSDKNTNSCPGTCNKTVTGYISQVKYYKRI